MNLRRLYVVLLLLIFVLPVVAAIGWDVSELVYLSSMSEEEYHVGFGITNLVLLSSVEEDLGHIGEGISYICMLSSVRYGDVDNNTLVESFDASLVLQYFCLIEPQGAPLPWEDWRQTIADVDGNAAIEAYDASLILMYSVDLIDVFPVEEEPVVTRKEGRSSTAKGAK